MEQKTKVHVEEGKQEIVVTREFDLPISLLFKAYVEAQFVEQWMGTTVLQLDAKKHGAFQFETCDKDGNVILRSHGVIHDIIENKSIIRTFEMENTPFPVQLEYLDFEALNDDKSCLTMKVIYKSQQVRDEILKLPFVFGINMAHNKLEKLFKN